MTTPTVEPSIGSTNILLDKSESPAGAPLVPAGITISAPRREDLIWTIVHDLNPLISTEQATTESPEYAGNEERPAATVTSNSLSQIHSFSRTLATKHGWKAAVILQYLAVKIAKSEHLIADKRWYYDTIDGLAAHFPYIHRATVHNVLAELTKPGGPLLKGNHNKHRYDRTGWYAFADYMVRKSVSLKPLYFSVKDAMTFGVVESVLLMNIAHWIKHNRKTNPDYTWHRMSGRGMTKHLPFSKWAINRALSHLFREGVLDRRSAGGCCKEHEYRILDETRLDGAKLDIDGAELDIDGANLDMHGAKLDNNTYLEDTVSRHHVKRHSYIERPASPAAESEGVFSNSPELNSSKASDSSSAVASPNRPIPVQCPAAPAAGKGSTDSRWNSPRNSTTDTYSTWDEDRKKQWVNEQLSQVRRVTYCYIPSDKTETPAPVVSTFDKEQQERIKNCVSPDKDREGDATLSAGEKVNILRNSLIACNMTGYVGSDDRYVNDVVAYSGNSFKAAYRFFQANPDVSVEHLNQVLWACVETKFWNPVKDDAYDPLFCVHRGTHLSFLLGNLDKIVAQLNYAEFLPPLTFLTKEELGLSKADTQEPKE